MPKAKIKKRNSVSSATPYAAAKTKTANNIFKMNTDIGQHVLINPGIARTIVEKADLKQSDVCDLNGPFLFLIFIFFSFLLFSLNNVGECRSIFGSNISPSMCRWFSKLDLVQAILR
jgi:hypothetical protein